MASVYILFSKTGDCFYVGSCRDLTKRVEQHIAKKYKNSFTTKYSDWETYFSIDNLKYTQARKIETHIKKMKSKTYIQNLKKYPEISERLVEKYSA